MSLVATVVVCTHNNSELLGRTVVSLVRCASRDQGFEIVVVDNASTDDTAAVVAELIRGYPHLELRYVYEPRLGLHHARHAGARAARSELILYTDDDVEVDPSWVAAYAEAFANHPEMAAAGGPALPRWGADPPTWVREAATSSWFCLPLALIDRGPEFQLSPGADFFGLNMAVRADALSRFGGFRPELIGSAVVGSGEWGLQMAMQRAGALVGWIPAARVRHWVPHSRMEPRHFERWVRMESASLMFERWHLKPRHIRSLAADFRRIVRSNWRSWLRAARVRRAPDTAAIAVRTEAFRGAYELAFLWRIITSRELRGFLDTERFGP